MAFRGQGLEHEVEAGSMVDCPGEARSQGREIVAARHVVQGGEEEEYLISLVYVCFPPELHTGQTQLQVSGH